jgi:hypothetical protein
MHGVAKALLKTASVIALLSGSLLLPGSASAQFGFPGIQFRVPYIGGGHYRGRHHKTHESSRHERRSRGEPEESESAEHNEQNNSKTPQPLSAPIKDAQPPQQAVTAAPPKPAGEEPTFSPSR